MCSTTLAMLCGELQTMVGWFVRCVAAVVAKVQSDSYNTHGHKIGASCSCVSPIANPCCKLRHPPPPPPFFAAAADVAVVGTLPV